MHNCYQIFDNFFLKCNPFSDLCDTRGQDLHGSLFGTAYGGANQPKKPIVSDVFVNVPCTLIEFYNGCVKNVVYFRQELALDGYTMKTVKVEKKVIVKPGFSNFNSLTFNGEGNTKNRHLSTNLIVTFTEVALPTDHKNYSNLSRYTRKGHHLYFRCPITLQQAINAESVKIETLDGRLLLVPVDSIVNPKTVACIPGEGMPVFTSRRDEVDDDVPKYRGDLFVKFQISFPKFLTEDQRERMARVLNL